MLFRLNFVAKVTVVAIAIVVDVVVAIAIVVDVVVVAIVVFGQEKSVLLTFIKKCRVSLTVREGAGLVAQVVRGPYYESHGPRFKT